MDFTVLHTARSPGRSITIQHSTIVPGSPGRLNINYFLGSLLLTHSHGKRWLQTQAIGSPGRWLSGPRNHNWTQQKRLYGSSDRWILRPSVALQTSWVTKSEFNKTDSSTRQLSQLRVVYAQIHPWKIVTRERNLQIIKPIREHANRR